MNPVSVSEAAGELGVSGRRVRQMLDEGSLLGRQVGGVWLVDSASLDLAVLKQRPAGRAWKASMCWSVLAVANSEDPNVEAYEKSRIFSRLDKVGLLGLAPRLRSRCTQYFYYGHPSVIKRLEAEESLVLSGVSAAGHHNVDIVVFDFVEAYVSSDVLDRLVEHYALAENMERPNIILRSVDENVWPFVKAQKFASWPIVAVDLLESNDGRTRRAARELIERES